LICFFRPLCGETVIGIIVPDISQNPLAFSVYEQYDMDMMTLFRAGDGRMAIHRDEITI
jgi:hypothetical protein